MLFILISVIAPIVMYVLLTQLFTSKYAARVLLYKKLLIIAGLLFFISWYLPSPLIDGRNTSFTTHFIGGGVFCGFIWLYIVKVMAWRAPNIFIEAASLYALVCAFGVLNELAELFFVKAGLTRLTLTDTSWDLVANTLGALAFYIGYLIVMFLTKHAYTRRP